MVCRAAFLHPLVDSVGPPLPSSGRANQDIDETTVWRALFDQSPRKAPGPDRLNFSAPCLTYGWDARRVIGPIRRSIKIGHHSKAWKRVKMVMLWKPNKLDYTTVKS